MCGRYTLTSQEGLVEDFEAALDPDAPKNEWFKARFNVAPTQDAPIVRLRDGVRVIEMMRWGLVPFWGAKQGAKPPLMINARLESIESKKVFRDALERRRCLVPADGFFEWKKDGKPPQSIHRQDRFIGVNMLKMASSTFLLILILLGSYLGMDFDTLYEYKVVPLFLKALF